MKSILSSNKPVLKAENVNITFKLDLHRQNSWRDVFVNLTANPALLLQKERDTLHVVRDLNFEIYEGERVGLLGVNGAGKTSLCRCIAGMVRPNTGKITATTDRRALFTGQAGIHPELTGRENVELLVEFLYPESHEKNEIAREAMEFSELGQFLDVPYKSYSTGMQTRIFLSLVTARPAGLLILDEVFDGADNFFREKISSRMGELIRRSGAVIFVSHVYDQLIEVCNRVLVLNKGRIEFDGPPKEAISVFQTLRPAI